VQNGSSPRTSWQVTWTLPNGQTITQLWNASYTVSGSTVTARNLSYDGTLAANASTSFGFTGTSSGVGGTPTGLTCQ
jgi:cellulase/cellobiase CelA1